MSDQLPSVTSQIPRDLRNFIDRLRELIGGRGGRRLVSLDELVDAGVVTTNGSNTIIPTPPSGLVDSPPAPTNVAATGAVISIIIDWDAPIYNGHSYSEVWGAATDNLGAAQLLGMSPGRTYVDNTGANVSRYYWVRFVNTNDEKGPYNAVSGVLGGSTRIGNVDLGPLVVEAGNLASGAVTAAKVAAGAIELTKFAADIEPVTVVQGSTIPAVKSTNTIYVVGLGKLFRWDASSGQYVSSVPTVDLVGEVVSNQIANNAITTAKFAMGLTPVEIVNALPSTGNTVGRTVFLTTDNKLYRYTASGWTAAVASADIAGQISDAQIAGLAAGKVTGQLTNAQLADIAAAKITGQLTNSQIADVAAAKLTGQITEVQIANDAISAPKILAGAISTAKLAAGAVTADTIAANAITSAKIEAGAVSTAKLAAGAVTADTIAANAITSAKIEAGAITTAKIAAGAVQASTIAAGAIVADKLAANAVTAASIAADAVTAGAIAAGAVTADEIAANAINADKIAANAISADKILANAITAGKIAADAVTADKIAANAVTADKITANAITTGKIAAGAVNAAQIAAGAISTDKLLVTGKGQAINDDPNTQDLTAWTGTSGVFAETDTTAPVGTSIFRITGSNTLLSRPVPIDITKNYQLRVNVRQTSGTSSAYLTVAFFDANGTNISGGASGWPSTGTYFYYGVYGTTLPTSWTEYRISFGPGETAKIPANAKTCSVGILPNYSGAGEQRIAGMRLMLKADADLIVDGSIIADKIAAGAIAVGTAAIQNGAIVNAMIANLAVTNAKIADASITEAKIDNLAVTTAKITNGAITNAKIANLAVGSAQIQDLAVGSAKIADASISNAKIANLAVDAAKIADAAIGSAKIAGTIQSDNWVAASAGWQINKAGTATFNQVTVRGTVEVGSSPAVSGSTMTGSGAVINSSGTFAMGNSTKNISFNGTTLTVNGELIVTGNLGAGAASGGYAATSGTGSVSVTVTVPTGASALFVIAYVGDPYQGTFGSGKDTYQGTKLPVGTLTVNGSTVTTQAGTLIYSTGSPASGTYTVSVSRDYNSGTMTLGVLVAKR